MLSQADGDESSFFRGSETDDLSKNPSYSASYKIKIDPTSSQATRASKKCIAAAVAKPTAFGYNLATSSSAPTSKDGATITNSDVTLAGGSKAGKMENILKAFVGQLPYFGIPQEANIKKNIIPINEVSKFIRIIDTQTDKARFTEDGKIAVLKRQLLGAARDHWSKYTSGGDWSLAKAFLLSGFPDVLSYSSVLEQVNSMKRNPAEQLACTRLELLICMTSYSHSILLRTCLSAQLGVTR